MHWLKILTPLLAASLWTTAATPALAQNRGDDVLLEMQQAFRKGDKAKLLNELKHGNERLRHKTKELMQVVRQQNHFLNVVSHELRTPLNNSLEMLNQLSATRLDEDQAELFQDLDKANIDVTRSVKMLMDYADSMLGELQLDEEAFDLRALWLDRLRLVSLSLALAIIFLS